MMLLISMLLALVPLLGIAYIFLYGAVTTVDGLFMALILLTISGCFGLNVLLELKRLKDGEEDAPASNSGGGSRSVAAGTAGARRRGTVQSVQFYEAPVGQPNKSIVVLANGAKRMDTLVLDGDVRNALPIGRRVEITLRDRSLLNVQYV
jgi:hypothetical protein